MPKPNRPARSPENDPVIREIVDRRENRRENWATIGRALGMTNAGAQSAYSRYYQVQGQQPPVFGKLIPGRRKLQSKQATKTEIVAEAPPAPAREPADEHLEAGLLEVRDEDEVYFGGQSLPPVVTIAMGDTQHGEKEFLLGAWSEICDRIMVACLELQPARIRFAFPGDNVTGARIFRGQEYQVVLPNTLPQVAYSAEVYLRDLIRPLVQAFSTTTIDGCAVDGNHDADGGNLNLASLWCDTMRRLDGPIIRYGGQRVAMNLAPEGAAPYVIGLEHGFGGGAYNAANYSLQRSLMSHAVQSGILGRFGGTALRRYVTGHTHWLNISQDILASGLFVDTVGGWTRPERYKLGGAARGVGAIMYVHTGSRLSVRALRPSPAVLLRDVDDHLLHFRVMRDVADTMMGLQERAAGMGLLALPGQVY